MKDDTCIGAATPIVASASGVEDLTSVYGETVGEKFMSAARGYAAGLAERNSRRSLLARAMVDKKVEVYEVLDENGQTLFVERKDKKPEHTVVRVWSTKGSLLTLTAAEAERCGIADKVVASRGELFAELGAVKARQVYDKSALKARAAFEKVEEKFNKVLLTIESLEKQIGTLAGEVAELDEIISRTDRVTYYKKRRYTIKRREYHPTAVKELSHKGELCLKLLKELKDEYEKALPMAERNPDLNHRVSDIEKAIQSAETTFQEISARLERES
jgi:hypothetical protein